MSAHALRCEKKNCRAPLVERKDAIGRLSFVCGRCERIAAGLCVECPTRRDCASPRCAACRKARELEIARRARNRRYRRPEVREAMLEHAREYRDRPGVREKRLAYDAAYRRAHPKTRDDVTRAYDRAQKAKKAADPAWRDRVNAMRRERWRQKAEELRAKQSERRRRRLAKQEEMTRAA